MCLFISSANCNTRSAMEWEIVTSNPLFLPTAASFKQNYPVLATFICSYSIQKYFFKILKLRFVIKDGANLLCT